MNFRKTFRLKIGKSIQSIKKEVYNQVRLFYKKTMEHKKTSKVDILEINQLNNINMIKKIYIVINIKLILSPIYQTILVINLLLIVNMLLNPEISFCESLLKDPIYNKVIRLGHINPFIVLSNGNFVKLPDVTLWKTHPFMYETVNILANSTEEHKNLHYTNLINNFPYQDKYQDYREITRDFRKLYFVTKDPDLISYYQAFQWKMSYMIRSPQYQHYTLYQYLPIYKQEMYKTLIGAYSGEPVIQIQEPFLHNKALRSYLQLQREILQNIKKS